MEPVSVVESCANMLEHASLRWCGWIGRNIKRSSSTLIPSVASQREGTGCYPRHRKNTGACCALFHLQSVLTTNVTGIWYNDPMDIIILVDTICEEMRRDVCCSDGSYEVTCSNKVQPSSRHSRMYAERTRALAQQAETAPMAFRHAADWIVRRYTELMQTPVDWTGSRSEQRDREIVGLRKSLAELVDRSWQRPNDLASERHAPNLVGMVNVSDHDTVTSSVQHPDVMTPRRYTV